MAKPLNCVCERCLEVWDKECVTAIEEAKIKNPEAIRELVEVAIRASQITYEYRMQGTKPLKKLEDQARDAMRALDTLEIEEE